MMPFFDVLFLPGHSTTHPDLHQGDLQHPNVSRKTLCPAEICPPMLSLARPSTPTPARCGANIWIMGGNAGLSNLTHYQFLY